MRDKPRPKKPKKQKPAQPPATPPHFPPRPAVNGHASGPLPAPERNRLEAVSASCTFAQLQHHEQEWLIDKLLPAGDLLMVGGDTHSGKSTLFTTAAAALSRPAALLGGETGGKLRTLMFGREEKQSAAPLGRLRCEAADLAYVTAGDLRPDGQPGPPLILPDQAEALAVRAINLRASLIVIDPLVSYMAPGLSPMDGGAVRAVLECLQAVARRTGACIVTVAHLRKSRAGSIWDWISGTKEWVNVPRFLLTLGRDPRDATRRIAAMPKSPAGDALPPTVYRLEKVPPGIQFRLGAAINLEADDLHGEPDDQVTRSARQQCREYLRAVLDQQDVEQTKLVAEAQKLGLSVSTLRRACLDLGVTSHFVGEYGAQHWVWRKPAEWPE